jgi:hypothetical protein
MDRRQTTPPHGPDAPPAGGPNGAGWDWRADFHEEPPQWRPGMPDLSAVLALLEAARRMVPPELQEQFATLQREVLLTIRALIDWYLERLDGGAPEPRVEDIPID